MSSIGVVMKFQRKALAIAVMVATSTLSACSSDDIKDILDRVPTDIKLSGVTVDENEKGAEIATLETIDLDIEESFSYTTDNENFVISGKTLSLAADYSVDFENQEEITFNITVTDKNDNTYTQAVTIAVNNTTEISYEYLSQVADAASSSVSYGGQTTRHALIAELKHYIGKGGLQADIDRTDSEALTTKEQVIAKLNSFYNRGGDVKADREISWDGFAITFTDGWTIPAEQKLFSDIGSYKSLKDKVAGNDYWGQSKKWNDGDFAGWGAKGSITPTQLIAHYFEQLADNAVEVINGALREDPITKKAIKVYVNEDGTDLNQLIQKFLLMSVTYSQATDDYLHEKKGLAANNLIKDKGTKDFTSLEHQFDEGFGYFGATRDYLFYNDYEIAGKVNDDGSNGRTDWNGMHDTNGDGVIDLKSEKMFGNSVNAAKRDIGTKGNAKVTNFSDDAMQAFLNGRKLINENSGLAETLPEAQMTELVGYRNAAVDAWENAVAATVVHYINDLNKDLDKLGTDEFDFSKTAKHFSELKGFALGLQFNPYSPMTDAQFEAMHVLLKDAPVLVVADVAVYQSDLIKARDILQAALKFDAENVAGW